eukprot:59089-Pyramimonas_sp.AAC.2
MNSRARGVNSPDDEGDNLPFVVHGDKVDGVVPPAPPLRGLQPPLREFVGEVSTHHREGPSRLLLPRLEALDGGTKKGLLVSRALKSSYNI